MSFPSRHFYQVIFLKVLFVVLLCSPSTASSAQKNGFHEWLREESIDKVIIELNWDSLVINKNSDKEWESRILCISTKGDSTRFKAEIASRGKYRRRICEYPPLMLDIKKKSLRKQDIDDDVDEYKLVYYCDKSFKRLQLIETEALIYKLYNELDTNSFQIREILVEVYDLKGKMVQDGPAFIIESDKEFAKRKKLYRTSEFGHKDSLELNDLYRFTLFQFFISNHDWNIDMLKNVELFQKEDGQYMIVPYDFDFCGWVEAPYWVGRTDLGLNYTEDRYLFLDEVDFGILEKEWQLFITKRAIFESLINDHPTLKKSKKRRMLKSIDSFFKLYNDIVGGKRKFLEY